MKRLKNIKWIDIRLFLIGVIVLALYSFGSERNRNREIESIEVLFKGHQSHFVTGQEIHTRLQEVVGSFNSQSKVELNLSQLENDIQRNLLIQDADVYITLDGKLCVDIWQKDAIARLFVDGESFYLDQWGNQMPVSSNFSKRVPMISGQVNELNKDKVKCMLDIIGQDEFLKNDITGILLSDEDSIELLSRTNSYRIIFGGFDQMSRKLDNYKAFVQYSLQDGVSLEKYKKINLKFTQQVVCVK